MVEDGSIGPAAGRGTIMAFQAIIIWLIIGAVAGWLAGLIVKGAGFGLVGNVVIGIIGAAVAGWLLHLTNPAPYIADGATVHLHCLTSKHAVAVQRSMAL
jgi:uncharacterized membrane protein YeaQ/YmgE (transglycosylase-associated protein family)